MEPVDEYFPEVIPPKLNGKQDPPDYGSMVNKIHPIMAQW